MLPPKHCRFIVAYRYSTELYYTVAEMQGGSNPGKGDDVMRDLEGFDGVRELKNLSSNETLNVRVDYHSSDLGGVISRLRAKGCDYYDYLNGH
jgi:hypothetical protein